jgi:tetratricopeptide (TPR) repeat protein
VRGSSVLVLFAACLSIADARAQPEWIQAWLREYAAGRHAEVATKLRSVGDLKAFEADLDRTAPAWLAGTEGSPESRRRVLAAFALESASAQLERGAAAMKILEFGCRQIRRNPKPDEFDRRWHLAAFALFAGAVDPDGLEAHVVHARFQFPNEPWLPFERAVASELRTFPRLVAETRVSAGDVTKRLEEAAKRYVEASKNEATRAEAGVRLGRIEIALGHPDRALEALEPVPAGTDDQTVKYLAQLFRGQALERLKRPDEARQAYEAALALRPGAQSASMGLAALVFRAGDRAAADRQVRALLDQPKRPDDPWWTYWPADFRHLDARLSAMRESVR